MEINERVWQELLQTVKYLDDRVKVLEGKQKNVTKPSSKGPNIPTFEEVLEFAKQQNIPEHTAEACFLYYDSIGWIRGGKIPIKSWKSCVQGWAVRNENYR